MSLQSDTAHTIQEFHAFPWNQLDDKWFSQCGGIGRGCIIAGVDFNRPVDRPTIIFVREDTSADVWEIPEELSRLLERYFNNGQDNLRMKFKQLMERSR